MIEILTIPIILYVGVLFLLIISLIDLKTYDKINDGIPSAITTAFILIAFLVMQNIELLIIAGLVSWLIRDMGAFEGLADVKTFIATAILMGNKIDMFTFILLFFVLLVIMQIAIKKLNRTKKEMPCILVITLTFIVMIVIAILTNYMRLY